MSNNWFSSTAHRPLTTTMIGFAAAYALHAIDHFRRGMAASPPSIMVGGTIQGIIVLIAVVLVVRHHQRACEAAIDPARRIDQSLPATKSAAWLAMPASIYAPARCCGQFAFQVFGSAGLQMGSAPWHNSMVRSL